MSSKGGGLCQECVQEQKLMRIQTPVRKCKLLLKVGQVLQSNPHKQHVAAALNKHPRSI